MCRLEVIFKIAERCNIDCSYCYVFNGADSSYQQHPKLVPSDVFRQLLLFLKEGIQRLDLRSVQIDFHGGEPLLIGKQRFAQLCEALDSVLGPSVDLRLALQTNALLVDEEWARLLRSHRVRTSISIDGPQDYHDEFRTDFKGRGTYKKVVDGLEWLRDPVSGLREIGVLCVIDARRSARRIYRHFVDDLGVSTMDFLLRDQTHDSLKHVVAENSAGFLCDLFDAWMEDDDPEIQVRVLNSVMSLLLGGRSRVTGYGLEVAPAITIGSDGSIGPDDTLRGCGAAVFDSGMSIFDTSLKDFLASTYYTRLSIAHTARSAQCTQCCWERVCGGGAMVNRYSKDRGFDNTSVYCLDLQRFYAHVAARLVRDGHRVRDLVGVLIPDAADDAVTL